MLSAVLCYLYGICHLAGYFGPGCWTSDSYGIAGSIRLIKPMYSLTGLGTYSYGVISSNHIIAGFVGLIISLWHTSTRPGPALYKLLGMSNIEGVLSSSISAIFFSAIISTSIMWYGSVSTAIELFGPSRFHWDNAYFTQELNRRVASS